jgi:hypothetical protein
VLSGFENIEYEGILPQSSQQILPACESTYGGQRHTQKLASVAVDPKNKVPDFAALYPAYDGILQRGALGFHAN